MFSLLATEDVVPPRQDLGGFSWESELLRKNWERWNPSRFAHNWDTPHFVLHTNRNFRLGVDDGLVTFNALQIKGVPSAFPHSHDEGHVVL